MEQNEVADTLLKEFFNSEPMLKVEDGFIDSLQEDFLKIMEIFRQFVANKLSDKKLPPEFDFISAASLLVNEICSFKLACLRQHTKILLESAIRVGEESKGGVNT